jgi:hypothetical protein
VEGFIIEIPRWPSRQPIENIPLRNQWHTAICPGLRIGKLILDVQVRAHTDDENSPALLGHTIVLGVQGVPSNSIAGQPETLELIVEQYSIVTVCHAVHVLNHERFRHHNS